MAAAPGTAINHGANPMPGSVPNGAMTTMSEAIVAAQCGMGNTSPFQLELDPGITQAQGGVEKVMALLKTHLQQGGTLINVNIVDAQKVRAAHKNPELYPDLVVRVTGFTAYFITAVSEFRQLVVDGGGHCILKKHCPVQRYARHIQKAKPGYVRHAQRWKQALEVWKNRSGKPRIR